MSGLFLSGEQRGREGRERERRVWYIHMEHALRNTAELCSFAFFFLPRSCPVIAPIYRVATRLYKNSLSLLDGWIRDSRSFGTIIHGQKGKGPGIHALIALSLMHIIHTIPYFSPFVATPTPGPITKHPTFEIPRRSNIRHNRPALSRSCLALPLSPF